MSIFGTKKRQMRGCGCQGAGLGALEVPWWCWDKGGEFDTCMATALKTAQYVCQNYVGDEKTSCEAKANDEYAKECISKSCASSPPSTTTATTTGGSSIVCPQGQWPNASFTACVKSTGACSDANVIKSVQAQIGTTVDGKWGPLSAAALKASGKTYQQLAPGCSGAVPGGAGSGTGGGKYTPPPGGGVPVKPPVEQASAGFLGIPLIVWGGVAAVAVVLLIAKSKKKPIGAVANRRRHCRRNGCHR